MRFHHVGLSVSDLERATGWYRDVLGFTPGHEFAIPPIGLRGRFLELDGVSVELLEQEGAVPGPDRADPAAAAGLHGFGHICLLVDALEEVYARFVAAGARPVWDPRVSPSGSRMAFIADLDGNLVELIDRTP
jgi:catechol 2,3-dioxygenase-like lactoylglutathione lyase family enzyme